jgi:RNA polymerase sigma-70 factor (ECF subfamily)
MAEALTSKTLLFRIRDSSDAPAWESFCEIYTPLVYHFSLKRGLSNADAADIVQDLMTSVAKAIGEFSYDSNKGTFRSWLYTITRNCIRKHFRKLGRQPASLRQSAVTRLADDQDSDDSAETLWEYEYRRNLFHWAVRAIRDEFQEQTWQAFWRTAVDDVPAAAVAEELSMQPGAVYTSRSRVLARLRIKVGSVAGDPDDFLSSDS